MTKFSKTFAEWSDRLDRIEKKFKVTVTVRKTAAGYVAKIGKDQVGSFDQKIGGYTYL